MWQRLTIKRARRSRIFLPGKVRRIVLIQRSVSRGLPILTVGLAFSSGGGEVALFGFAATSDTWRVMGFVDRPKVAANLSPPARNLQAYISKRGGIGQGRLAIRRLDRSSYAVVVQMNLQHVRRYVSSRR